MSRRNLLRTNLYPYHVTTRTNNKEWFDIPLDEIWRMCKHSLKHANSVHKVDIIAFVLMHNHYHLIVKTPDKNIDLFMYELNKRLSLLIRTRSKRINSVFGGRYKWSLIRSQTYLYNCYRYVYQNPVRAGITKRCEYYPYSTLHCLLFKKKFPLPLIDVFGFKDEFALNWLNHKVLDNEIEAIRKGLKKAQLNILKSSSKFKIQSYNAP